MTLNRRTCLLAAGVVGGLPALITRRANAASTTLNLFIWTGAQEVVPRRIAESFVQTNQDVKIEITVGTNAALFPRLKASLDIDPTQPLINVGFFNMDATSRGLLSDMWLPIGPSVVPNIASIRDEFRQPQDKGAFFCMDVVGIVYNPQKISTPPTSWNDLWNPAYKGRVTAFDGFFPGNGLVTTARVRGGGEDNIEPGMKVYEEAAKAGHFHSLFTANAQLLQLMASGEVWIAPYLRGIAIPWKQQGAPIDYVVPKEGQAAFPEGFQLVRGSSAAQQRVGAVLLNEMLTPEAVMDYCVTAAVLPLLKGASLPPELRNDPAVQPEAIANAMQLDYGKIAVNTPAWTDMWNKRVKANLR